MPILTKLFLILGVASITYGIARWQIVTEVLAQQQGHFEQFFAVHSGDSTNQVTAQEVGQLRKRVMMSGGSYPGWPQAILPLALGAVLLAVSYYFGQKKTHPKHEPAASNHAKARAGQFALILRSLESASDDARVKGMAFPSDQMRSATCPPDAVLRAYSDLLSRVLLFQRTLSGLRDVNMDEARDLADAMHNIAELLVDYGVHLDDEQYRALYLRPFDRRWAQNGFGLEQFLESRLSRYAKEDYKNPDAPGPR